MITQKNKNSHFRFGNREKMDDFSITYADVLIAQKNISDKIHKTPMQSGTLIGNELGIQLYFKCENLQKTGSFKVRGALNKLSNLNGRSEENGVIAVSAGNHGQALAWAANFTGKPCTIVMPETATQAKIDACRSYGADVILHGTFDTARTKALEMAHENDMIFVHPFDDLDIITGQGTLGIEIMSELQNIDIIVCAIGGGGLISGLALVAKHLNPNIKIYGVEPEGARSMRRSLDKDAPIENNEVNTIADGLGTPMAGKLTFEYVKKYVDDVVTVSDEQIIESMKILLTKHKLLAEPAGAAAFAGLYLKKIPFQKGDKIVTVISGGNTDLSSLKSFI